MNISVQNKKILVLAPHTDDAELGCGATISMLSANGNEVYCAAFSACRQSVRPEFPENILETEVREASAILGIKPDNLFLFEYEVRTFNYHRQAILDDIIRLRDRLKPDLVFVPSLSDIHQDHQTIAQESVRVFKFSTLLCYELPWNNFTFNTTLFFRLDEQHIETKARALACYKSQAHRDYMQPGFINSLARVRGVQVGVPYAEVFEVVRMIM